MNVSSGLTRTGAAAVAAAVAAGALAGCTSAEDKVPSIGYAIDNTVGTYNANTVDGATSGARQAFPRVQTGFSYLGPEGKSLADNDIGGVSTVPADVLTVAYTIAPQAVYSDGVPMTCDDLVLTWAANSGRFVEEDDVPLFDAASSAGYADIERVDCAPGSKTATVVYEPGRSYQEWRSLFAATELLPSHVVAQAAGIPNVVDPILSGDIDSVRAIAQFWNTGWTLTPGAIDTALLPSNGPYRVDSYTQDGGLVLVANEKWWGIAPETERVVVWPKGTDLQAKVDAGDMQVVDSGAGGDLPAEGFGRTDFPSHGVEQLTFATTGALGSASARRALALCTPREQLFDDVGHPGFERATGIGSGVIDSRLMQPNSLLYGPVAAVADGGYRQPDAAASTDALEGETVAVRIGYLAPDPRRARIVADLAAACAPAGITVEDVGSTTFAPSALRAGVVDAVLGSTATVSEAARYSLHSDNGSNVGGYTNNRVDEIVDQLAVEQVDGTALAIATEGERILWNEMPTLPLFNQPRTVAASDGLSNVVVNATTSGVGWNMDRWILHQ